MNTAIPHHKKQKKKQNPDRLHTFQVHTNEENGLDKNDFLDMEKEVC